MPKVPSWWADPTTRNEKELKTFFSNTMSLAAKRVLWDGFQELRDEQLVSPLVKYLIKNNDTPEKLVESYYKKRLSIAQRTANEFTNGTVTIDLFSNGYGNNAQIVVAPTTVGVPSVYGGMDNNGDYYDPGVKEATNKKTEPNFLGTPNQLFIELTFQFVVTSLTLYSVWDVLGAEAVSLSKYLYYNKKRIPENKYKILKEINQGLIDTVAAIQDSYTSLPIWQDYKNIAGQFYSSFESKDLLIAALDQTNGRSNPLEYLIGWYKSLDKPFNNSQWYTTYAAALEGGNGFPTFAINGLSYAYSKLRASAISSYPYGVSEYSTILIEEPVQMDTLYLLGAAANGDQMGDFIINYSDGTQDTFTQSFTDWANNTNSTQPLDTNSLYPGETLLYTFPFYAHKSKAKNYNRYLFGYSFDLDPSLEVESIYMPYNYNIRMLGASYSPPIS
jgi:hypothetical protein